MATFYVDDDGDNSDGLSWATAYTTLSNAITQEGGTGNTFYIRSDHVEGHTSSQAYAGGTEASPMILISANGSDVYTTGALIDATGSASDLTLNNVTYSYGVSWQAGDNLGGGTDSRWYFQDGYLRSDDNTAFAMGLFSADSGWTLKDMELYFGGSTAASFGFDDGASIEMIGCSLHASSLAVNDLFGAPLSRGGKVIMTGCDWSGMASSGNVIVPSVQNNGQWHLHATGIKLPTSGTITDGDINQRGSLVEVYGYGSGDTPEKSFVQNMWGTATTVTGTYRDDAVTYDGTNRLSWQVDTTADATNGFEPFRIMVSEYYADADKTHTLYLLTDSITFQDDEVWAELVYPTASDRANLKFTDTRMTDIISGTPANLATSAKTWTGSAATELEIDVTASGGAAGLHQMWLYVAYPSLSADLFACPDIDVSA